MTVKDTSITDFLRERGADTLPHPGGTLYEHCVRVAGLLADWGADRDLQRAGLCHACYGTDGFGPTLLGTGDRAVLSDCIGTAAEGFVYLYGSCDRDSVYPSFGQTDPVRFRDRFTGDARTLAEPEARALVELTAANELDVLRHSAAAKHGPGLLWLFAAARHRLSDAAWDAWSTQPRRESPVAPAGLGGGRTDDLVAVTGVDHLVLTVTNIDRTIDFYRRVLGMRPVTFESGRRALGFGFHKLNLHAVGHEIEPHAARPTAGSADLCLLTTASPDRVIAHLASQGVSPESGPVARTGARGAIRSVYVRDPDGNLIEVASYPNDEPESKAS